MDLMPFNKLNREDRWKDRFYFLCLLLIPIIIYFYFLEWRATSIHDDDLYLYKAYSGLDDTCQKMNVSLLFGQYRPVRDFFLHCIMQIFKKDFAAYYAFNVAIQAINTILFAYVLNLLLRSLGLSLFLSLILGLSRFCFYNITQLFDGGVLEGMAMTFFLLFLFFAVRASVKRDITVSRQKRDILWSILFANLSMYTHERYIVIFPFILLMIIFYPGFKGISLKQKALLSFLAVGSPVLSILIKMYGYSLSMLKGTGSTTIQFSFSSAAVFLRDAVSSVFQYSVGPEYMAGLQFSSLPVFYKALVLMIICLVLGVFSVYLRKAIVAYFSKQKAYPQYVGFFCFLPALFFLCMVPVIFQVKMELRWFQAPLCILILMFVIAVMGLEMRNRVTRHLLLIMLGASFLFTNFYYVGKGAKNLYYNTSARIGNAFDKAIRDSMIHMGVSNIYIWEKRRNLQREDEIMWAIGHGYFFEAYQSGKKNIFFADSIYHKEDTSFVYTFPNFSQEKDQVIFVDIQRDDQTFKYSITDITKEYLSDSLKKFSIEKFTKVDEGKVQYDMNGLTVDGDNVKNFKMQGFHENENGVRWTNGKASIGFIDGYAMNADSAFIEMKVYLPPVCKNIVPKIFIENMEDENREAELVSRSETAFRYKVAMNRTEVIKRIDIISDTINAAPDLRTLSFPFGSLEIRRIVSTVKKTGSR